MTYAKFAVMILATVLSGVAAALVDGSISPAEWINVLIAALGTVSVGIIPNVPGGVQAYAKYIVAALTAGLVALLSAISDNQVTTAELLQIGVAALAALGTFGIPNAVRTVARSP